METGQSIVKISRYNSWYYRRSILESAMRILSRSLRIYRILLWQMLLCWKESVWWNSKNKYETVLPHGRTALILEKCFTLLGLKPFAQT